MAVESAFCCYMCRVASTVKHPSLRQLTAELIDSLSREGKFGEAANVLLDQDDVQAAMEFYFKAGMPDQAARVCCLSPNIIV